MSVASDNSDSFVQREPTLLIFSFYTTCLDGICLFVSLFYSHSSPFYLVLRTGRKVSVYEGHINTNQRLVQLVKGARSEVDDMRTVGHKLLGTLDSHVQCSFFLTQFKFFGSDSC